MSSAMSRHIGSHRRALTTKQVRETEAEAISFVVCQAVGLQTGTASQDYIQIWRGDANLLARAWKLFSRPQL